MNTVLTDSPTKQSRTSTAYRAIVDRWSQIPDKYSEKDLAPNFMTFMFEKLGIKIENIKNEPHIGAGAILRPDYLIYPSPQEAPILAIEIKRRAPELSSIADKEFAEQCAKHDLYREAVGFDPATPNNGIRQYLDVSKVKAEFLAPYGLVFNGDFFQLWRRVDGLVFPLTPIQKVSKTSLPKLLKQIQKCLTEKPTALVTGIWNMKGGVAKTTSAINMAAMLALHGKNVLLIDLDLQGDLTHGLGFNPDHLPDFLTPVTAKLNLKEIDAAQAILKSAIQQKPFPTTEGESFSLSLLSTNRKALEAFRDGTDILPLQPFINMVELLKSEYDYIFIDTAPTLDQLASCLLSICDHVLVPIDGSKAIRHALRIHQEILPTFRQARLTHHLPYGPLSLGIVRSNWSVAQGAEKALDSEIANNFAGKQYETRLLQYAHVEVASLKQAPVVCWRKSPISKLYAELTNEVFLTHNFIAQ